MILGLKASGLLNSKCDQKIKINGGRSFGLAFCFALDTHNWSLLIICCVVSSNAFLKP